MTELPFGPNPYLWMSALILDTPSTLKSNFGTLYPSFSINGKANPPIAESTCRNIFLFNAISAISSTGSTIFF
jgi:hypothetical protein